MLIFVCLRTIIALGLVKTPHETTEPVFGSTEAADNLEPVVNSAGIPGAPIAPDSHSNSAKDPQDSDAQALAQAIARIIENRARSSDPLQSEEFFDPLLHTRPEPEKSPWTTSLMLIVPIRLGKDRAEPDTFNVTRAVNAFIYHWIIELL